MRSTLLAATAMGFFVICPRMAAMLHIIARHTQSPLYPVALIGTLFSVPLMLAIVWTFSHCGVAAAIGFCALTDVAAALLLSGTGWKAPLETAIIAAFVLLGVKVAPHISRLLLP